MKNNILTVFMLLCIAWPLSAQYTAGSGTEADPYQISSLEDLNDLSLSKVDWNKYFVLTEDIDASETRNYTNAYGDTVGFTPIGNSVMHNMFFGGTFDGQGHTISNLYINLPETDYVGLFGCLGTFDNDAYIVNLNMDNAYVIGNNYVGVLSGYTDCSDIYDCSIDGDVVGTSYVGVVSGISRSTIKKTTASGTVIGDTYVGGFVGAGANFYDVDVNYYACGTSSDVKGTNSVGGFAGALYTSSSYCYATGEVVGDENIGGYAGLIDASIYLIHGCFSTGNVTGSLSTIGGFAGLISAVSELSQCYANNVVITSDSTTVVGGFFGNYAVASVVYENNFYNSEISNTTMTNPDDVTGISSSAFSSASTYNSWDFEANWKIIQKDEFSVVSLPIPNVLTYDHYVHFESTIAEAGLVSLESAWLNDGEVMTVSCTEPINNYLFRGWYIGDSLVSTDKDLTFTSNADVTYTALYYVPYSGGQGTEASPYQLSTMEDFILLGETPTDYDKYFVLTNDIDFSASRNLTNADGDTVGFTPIGVTEQEFEGNLDGKGYSIKNLYINLPTSTNVALFGATVDTKIANLSLVDFHIEGYSTVASLVGDAFYTSISNCNFDGYVEAYEAAAGMCGIFRGVSLAEKCHSSADVKCTSSTAGGLVANLGADLLQCSSSATVYGYNFVGGLVGTNSGKIQYCYSTGNITGRYCVGGAMGVSNGYARTIFSSASVTQLPIGTSGDAYGYVGGFTGMQAYAYVYNCYAFGPVDADANQGGFYGGKDPSDSSIDPTDCYFDTETSNQRDRYKEGVTALKTSEFSDTSNFSTWDFEKVWKVDVIESLSAAPRPYTFPSLGLDCYLTTETENVLYGEVDTLSNFGWYQIGDVVTIDATPNEGFSFEGWCFGDVKVSSEAQYNVEVDMSLNLIAHFSPMPYSFAGGKGSVSDPFQISNYEELKFLSIHINELYGRNFILTDNIDASSSAITNDFASIGNADVVFNGAFDGQGYTISNLHINDLNSKVVGFFYNLDGTVENLILRDVDITGAYSAGGLAGIVSRWAQVRNCSVIGGTVTGTEEVGGFAGVMQATEFEQQPYMFNCHSDSLVVNGTNGVGGLLGIAKSAIIESSTSSAIVNGESYVGGFMGTGMGTIDKLLTIDQCSSTGAVNATSYAGGLIGYLAGYVSIDLSYSSADVTTTATEGFAGGLLGLITNTKVTNSYSVGTVESLDRAGGFIGYIDNNVLLSNCYTASEMDVLGMFSGGLCSEIAGSKCEITNTYYCTERSGFQDAYSSNASDDLEITPLSNSEAALEGSFPDFDFSGTWSIRVDSTIDTLARPYLKWQDSPVQVIITLNNTEVGTVTGDGFYANGETISLNAEAITGWKFSYWKDGDVIVSTSANYTFESSMNTTYDYEAVFEEYFTGLGTGTTADPYHIKTMTQLNELANLPTFWDKSFVVDNNIDASSTQIDEGFSPIGHETIPFTGNFDGQGYSINSLSINRPELINVGLFGYTKGATISNLTLSNIIVDGFSYVGTLIGQTYANEDFEDGLCTNVHSCHVNNATVEAYAIAGGFIGSIYTANVYNSTVSNITVDGGYYVGGFSGEILSDCEIDSCSVSEGSVNATDGFYVGGFVGRAVSTDIYNSTANVTTSGAQDIGGFAGAVSGYTIIENCSASGVSQADGTYPIVGGFVGYQTSSYISKCFATGDVECNDLFGGGFAGYTTGANSAVIEECYCTGKVTGRRMLGGFAGSVGSIIRFSYSTGEVDGTINGTVEEHEDIDVQFGGFAGRVNSGGYVGFSYTFSDVTGYILTAGFTAVNLGIIEECYCANEVTQFGSYYCGFAGYTEQSSSNYIKNCYYDYTLSPLDAVSMGDDIVGALTTEEFASQENMDLSFYGIWHIGINEDIDSTARPYLKNTEGVILFDIQTSYEYAGEKSGYGWYNDGEEIRVEITDIQPGLKFTHWEVDSVMVSSENPYTFDFDAEGSHEIMAMFEEENILSQGDGSESNPYEIATFDDLICLSNVSSIWDKHFILTDDIDASETMSMNSMSGFSPIGSNDSTRFTGAFDGQNHRISNIYISRTSDDDAQAFFANVGDSVHTTSIKNLTIDSAIIGGAYGVGVLVGDMINTQLDHCNAQGLLIGTGSYVGGLVGRSRDGSTITNSSFKGVVHSPSSTSDIATGGLVGYSLNTKIDFCYVVADSVVTWGESVGGLVGYSHNSEYATQTTLEHGIKRSFAIVGYIASVGDYTGGVVGSNQGAYLDQCYAVAPLIQYSSYGSYKGAIYGDNLYGEVTSTIYDQSVYQASSILEGTGLATSEFTNTMLFPDWDFTNDWIIAVGEGQVKRPYFANMDYSTVTFKVDGPGVLQVDGKGDSFTEQTDNILAGYDSRAFKATPSSGFELIQWSVENKGIWDNENITTYVPSFLLNDLVIVAEFKAASGLSDINADLLSVYPNPVQNMVYVDGIEATTQVVVVNAVGQDVYFGSYNSGIDVTALPSGVYVLQITESDKVISTSFIKQ